MYIRYAGINFAVKLACNAADIIAIDTTPDNTIFHNTGTGTNHTASTSLTFDRSGIPAFIDIHFTGTDQAAKLRTVGCQISFIITVPDHTVTGSDQAADCFSAVILKLTQITAVLYRNFAARTHQASGRSIVLADHAIRFHDVAAGPAAIDSSVDRAAQTAGKSTADDFNICPALANGSVTVAYQTTNATVIRIAGNLAYSVTLCNLKISLT